MTTPRTCTARRGRNRPVRIFPGMKENKRDIVAAMATAGTLERMAARITRMPATTPVVKDLAQTVYLYLLEFPEDKLLDLHDCGQLDFFVARILINQWYGSRSSFRVAFRKFSALTVDIREVIDGESKAEG